MADNGYQSKNWGRLLITYLVIAIVAYGAIYYVFIGKKNNSGTSSVLGDLNTRVINVSGNEYAFNPSTITVKVGQPVTLNFTNNGNYPHNLIISDLNVGTKTINPGTSDSIKFTPNQTGSFTFICTVAGHADRGMKGTLVVE